MEEKTPSWFRILWIIAIVIIALFAARFLLAMGRVLIVFAVLGMLGYGIFRLVKFIQARIRQQRHARSTEGIIENRVNRCQVEIEKNRTAIREVRKNILDLQEKLERANQATEESRQFTHKLIADFQSELELRQAKIHFLEACVQKLQTILQNLELGKTLTQKKSELKLLREQNFEDIADLEELRSDIEFDRTQLQTIDDLSTRMLGSQSLETVHALKRELEEMTRSLNRDNDL